MARPSNQNFRDPIGLVLRMLKSGNRAAWEALFREALGIAARPLDAALSIFERRCRKTSRMNLKKAVVRERAFLQATCNP